jgi:peptidyl-prolyl cis-trans isomerase C
MKRRKTHPSQIIRAGLVSSVLLLVSCGSGDRESIGSVAGTAVTQTEFDAYLSFKGLKATDDKRLKKLQADYINRKALGAAIESTGLLNAVDIEMELAEFKRQMLIARYFEKYLAEAVTEAGLKNYYTSNPGLYSTDKVHVAHILLRTKNQMNDQERSAKLTTAHEVYSKLQAQEDFSSLAATYSEDTLSAKKGGDLGWLQSGSIDPVFSDRIFKMKAGDISEPFQTSFGYHVVKILEAPQVVKRSFESVKGDIRYKLRSEAKQAEMSRLLKQVSTDVRQ